MQFDENTSIYRTSMRTKFTSVLWMLIIGAILANQFRERGALQGMRFWRVQ
jgi:hypothetical protein